jgi:N-dimethylarginine dimethylaminohydrolase
LLGNEWELRKSILKETRNKNKAKDVQKEKVMKNFKVYKERSEGNNTELNSKSPNTKASNHTYSSDKTS